MDIQIRLSKYKPINGDQLFQLGWLEIKDGDRDIEFFKKSLCMIFITLENLTDFLFSKRKNLDWIGEDSGYVYKIKRNKGILIFESKDFEYKCNEYEFNKNLFSTLIDLSIYSN